MNLVYFVQHFHTINYTENMTPFLQYRQTPVIKHKLFEKAVRKAICPNLKQFFPLELL